MFHHTHRDVIGWRCWEVIWISGYFPPINPISLFWDNISTSSILISMIYFSICWFVPNWSRRILNNVAVNGLIFGVSINRENLINVKDDVYIPLLYIYLFIVLILFFSINSTRQTIYKKYAPTQAETTASLIIAFPLVSSLKFLFYFDKKQILW